MLSKKEYKYTLLAAITIFFVMLLTTSFYFGQKGDRDSSVEVEGLIQEQPTLQVARNKEVVIMPQTKITIKLKDLTTKKEEKTILDPTALLGFNQQQIKEQFDDYTIETFSEKEVCLSRDITSTSIANKDETYVLGVEGDEVCIKDKALESRPVKIDYKINHLSSYIYSILLNEEIEITKEQKEALLLNPSTLQKILQDYVGE